MKDCAVAVVGGGPAGLATALFLTHVAPALRERIVVLEKERYPRDKICGGAIGARADKLLETIGVRVDVPSAGVREFTMRNGAGQISGRVEQLGRVVRRIEFDCELARIARSRGIRIEEGAKVTGLQVDADSVRLELGARQLTAAVVVGADGVHGFVRRAIGLNAGRFRAQVVEVDTEPAPGDPPRDALLFDFFSREFAGYAWDFPTIVNGRELVCRGVYHLNLDQRGADIRALLAERLAQRGLELGNYRLKRFAERGWQSGLNYAVPRVLLVGEAAGIDALTGEGIPQAIQYGAVAGRYVADKLARGDLSFRDWGRRVRKEQLGYDLRMREWLMLHYFGPKRARYEAVLAQLPSYAECSAQQLAGLPISNLRFFAELAGLGARKLFAFGAPPPSAAGE